jgi:hypothetical protein
MKVHHFITAGAIFAGAMLNGPSQATAMAGLGEMVSAHSYVALAQWGPYKYGGYVAPYHRRPFLYTYLLRTGPIATTAIPASTTLHHSIISAVGERRTPSPGGYGGDHARRLVLLFDVRDSLSFSLQELLRYHHDTVAPIPEFRA